MITIIHDREFSEALIAERRARGADHHDEVWEGVYMIPPLADDEHQYLIAELTSILVETVQRPRLGQVRPGVNVSDLRREWTKNYRCPDVAVRLEGGQAEIRDSYWLGGPDFLVEVVSPDDQTYEKLPFYQSIGTREVLVIERRPWTLSLYHLTDGKLVETGRSTLENGVKLCSKVVPLSFRLIAGQTRPQIEVAKIDDGQRWVI
ncbi:MAG: Uma2 family endonuclease [Planctomycetes bacterium]|nr:Uma2 family endonuclease [Planctomycetota bacterium]